MEQSEDDVQNEEDSALLSTISNYYMMMMDYEDFKDGEKLLFLYY